jgi:hypothetical protein
MKRISLSIAVAAACFCAPASAQTISGKYIITVTNFCQLTGTYNFSTAGLGQNYLNEIESNGSNFKQSLYQGTFNPTKGSVTVSGFDDGGDLEIFHITGSIVATLGSTITQTSSSGKMSYSNTATTFTIGGQVLNAMYGQIDKKGVAHYVTFQGVSAGDSGKECTEQGTASLQ